MQKHKKYMLQAINLAKKAALRNTNNLLVGCVIVKNNKIIGKGYYDSLVNKNHAEVTAINTSTESIEGSSVYVTLEPCSHSGKTPPCVNILIAKKVKEIIIPFKDPNPLVNGNGISKLKAAGINVITGVLTKECWDLNEEFLYYQIKKLPLITAKWASSLDGKLSTYSNNSKWISSARARKEAHVLRNNHAAILIGANTLLLDNPLLNVRYNLTSYKNPIRIILANDTNLNTKAQLWHDNSAQNWLLVPSANYKEDNNISYLKKLGVTIITLPNNNNGIITFTNIIKELGARGVSSLLIEGGASTLSYALESRLVNKIELFIAPLILGGKATTANFINNSFNTVKGAEKYKTLCYKLLGNTLWLKLLSQRYIKIKQNCIKSLQE